VPPPPLDWRLSTGRGDLTAERAASPCDVRPAGSIKPAPTIAQSVSSDSAAVRLFARLIESSPKSRACLPRWSLRRQTGE